MTKHQEVEWYRSLGSDTEFLTEDVKIGFAVSLERRLLQNNMSRAELARRLGTSQAYITKVLRGDSNLTIKTMVELADAVGSTLHLHIAPRQAGVHWFEVFQGTAGLSEEKSPEAASAWIRHESQRHNEYVSITAWAVLFPLSVREGEPSAQPVRESRGHPASCWHVLRPHRRATKCVCGRGIGVA